MLILHIDKAPRRMAEFDGWIDVTVTLVRITYNLDCAVIFNAFADFAGLCPPLITKGRCVVEANSDAPHTLTLAFWYDPRMSQAVQYLSI